MSNFTVLYDACVLYPAPLRDLLMYLALSDLYRAKWTNEIHAEWIRNVLSNRQDLSREMLERTRDQMNMHVRDCIVDNYQYLIPTLKLPDENDRHVLAAAIHSRSGVIVTYNLKDFPKKTLREFEIEAQHPDEFVMHLLDLSRESVCSAIKKLRIGLKNPPITAEEYLETLRKQSLTDTANALNEVIQFI